MMTLLKRVFGKLPDHDNRISYNVIKSGFWVFLLRALRQAFVFFKIILLARILGPKDFGIIGIALLTMDVLDSFTQSGYKATLIQKKENIDEYLNTAWSISVLRSVFLFTILFISAPIVAHFFRIPESRPFIQIVGISMLFDGFVNIGIVFFQKELKFNKIFVYEAIGVFVDFSATVVAIFVLRNVWAIAIGLIAGKASMCISSYILSSFRPRFELCLKKASNLWKFGRWVSWSSVLVFLITKGDSFLIGRVLGPTALGLYQMAYKISNLPATEVTHLISTVTFPAYVKIQHDLNRIKAAYLRVLNVTASLAMPLAGLLIALAPEFVRLMYGEKWMPIVPSLLVLCFLGLFRSIVATMGPVFIAIGKPGKSTKIILVQFILMGIIIFPLTKEFGIIGTALSGAIAYLFSLISHYLSLSKIVRGLRTETFKAIVVPFLSSLVLMLLLYFFKSYLIEPFSPIQLISITACGIIGYAYLLIKFDYASNVDVG